MSPSFIFEYKCRIRQLPAHSRFLISSIGDLLPTPFSLVRLSCVSCYNELEGLIYSPVDFLSFSLSKSLNKHCRILSLNSLSFSSPPFLLRVCCCWSNPALSRPVQIAPTPHTHTHTSSQALADSIEIRPCVAVLETHNSLLSLLDSRNMFDLFFQFFPTHYVYYPHTFFSPSTNTLSWRAIGNNPRSHQFI